MLIPPREPSARFTPGIPHNQNYGHRSTATHRPTTQLSPLHPRWLLSCSASCLIEARERGRSKHNFAIRAPFKNPRYRFGVSTALVVVLRRWRPSGLCEKNCAARFRSEGADLLAIIASAHNREQQR